ncbi:MAG: putative lipid II flippase FtsW [Clostridium sp.]|nr:putative lipid II flippase FtsW [Clostridium sp.]
MPYQRNRANRSEKYRIQAPHSDVVLSPPDTTLMVVVAFLVVIGLMAIFSAGAPKSMEAGQNPASFALKQFAYLIVGLFGLKYFIKLDYKKLKDWAVPFAWFVIAMLVLVDFTPLGVVVNGARRWIMLGPIQFQPSEMTKLAVIMLLSNAFYRDGNLFSSTKIMRYFVPILIMVFLVYKQPNLSMVILLLLTSMVMYLSVSGSIKYMLATAGAAITMMAGTFMLFGKKLLHGYQMQRIQIWLNPNIDPYGAGYNIIQSLLAFAAGGFWGVGYGNSKQKLAWLPEGHTDFIFAVIAEELGFLGCFFVIGLFWTFIHRGIIISSRANDMFGKLMAVGITLSIGLQAFINMSVSSSLIPATGVPLPFISYGGTSLIVSLCMVGILLNISKKRIKRIKNYDRGY